MLPQPSMRENGTPTIVVGRLTRLYDRMEIKTQWRWKYTGDRGKSSKARCIWR